MRPRTALNIKKSLEYARKKHPIFAESLAQALLIAQEELGEAIQAYNSAKDLKDIEEELAHTAAVIVRILNRECGR